jgi:hypothetical protein
VRAEPERRRQLPLLVVEQQRRDDELPARVERAAEERFGLVEDRGVEQRRPWCQAGQFGAHALPHPRAHLRHHLVDGQLVVHGDEYTHAECRMQSTMSPRRR